MTHRKVTFELVLLILISLNISSSQDITPDGIIANNITDDPIADYRTSNFDEATTYAFIKDIGNAKGVEVIRIRFKNAFRGADQDVTAVDWIWQVSDADLNQVLINNSSKAIITSSTPLELKEGYELAIKSTDLDGNKLYMELSKNGEVVDSTVVIPPMTIDDLYTYSAEDTKIIEIHFKNAFRGDDQDLATADRIWQVSDTDLNQVLINNSSKAIITSSTPLELKEGYELAIKSTDLDGNKLYMELSKNGEVVDSTVVIPPMTIDDLYTYSAEDTKIIEIHFKNAFRGDDQDLATADRIWQVSDTDLNQVLINNSSKAIITSSTPLELKEGYELAIKSTDLDGNKLYMELSKNGEVVDSTVVIPPMTIDDLYTYSAEDTKIIEIHFKNAFRGADQDLAAVDRIWQVSDIDSNQVLVNDSNNMILTSSTPLALKEGYELAIKSIDIDGNEIYIELSKNKAAIDSMIIIPNSYDPIYWNTKGLALYELGMYSEAIVACDEAIKLNSYDPIYWNTKGLALYELGMYSEAIEAYDEAIKLNSSDPIYWNNKGHALYELGMYSEAIVACDEAINLNSSDPFYWNNKGLVLDKLGKYDEAVKAYDEAIKLDPNDVDVWKLKGLALDELGRYDEAIEAYNKANSIDQTYNSDLIDIGNSHFESGKYSAAIKYYDEAIKQDPTDNLAWYNKGAALRMLHRDSEAKAAYAKARELGYSGTMTLMEMTTT